MKLRLGMVFANHKTAQVFDEVMEDSKGELFGAWSKLSFQEIIDQNPDVILARIEEYDLLHHEHYSTQPVQVTEERYWEMLEVLPPLDMHTSNLGTTFKMIERYSGNITDIFAQIGDIYWNFRDRDSMRHEEIIEKIRGAKA